MKNLSEDHFRYIQKLVDVKVYITLKELKINIQNTSIISIKPSRIFKFNIG